jgi:hypothetical protein
MNKYLKYKTKYLVLKGGAECEGFATRIHSKVLKTSREGNLVLGDNSLDIFYGVDDIELDENVLVIGSKTCNTFSASHGISKNNLENYIDSFFSVRNKHKLLDGSFHVCTITTHMLLSFLEKNKKNRKLLKYFKNEDVDEDVDEEINKEINRYIDKLKTKLATNQKIIDSLETKSYLGSWLSPNESFIRKRSQGIQVIICPGCGTMIERTSGCCIMTCLDCLSKGILLKICVYCFEITFEDKTINIGSRICNYQEHNKLIKGNISSLPLPSDFCVPTPENWYPGHAGGSSRFNTKKKFS